jgi:hypothetical protein
VHVVHDPDLEVVVHARDAVDALGGLLRLELLGKAADGPAERHISLVDVDGDPSLVHLGVPSELVADVSLEPVVSHLIQLLDRCLGWRSAHARRGGAPGTGCRQAV